MDCNCCLSNISKLKDIYRQYNNIIICINCAPKLVKCGCNKVLSIHSMYNHHKSKRHTQYILNKLECLNLNI